MKFSKEDKAGLYITVIIHLTVIIILLASQIGTTMMRENSFVLDFTKQEEKEKKQAEVNFNEDILKKIDDLINGTATLPVRNVAVDRGSRSSLKDDRNTDADQLYKDAEKLQNDLMKGPKMDNPEDFAEIPDNDKSQTKPKEEKAYSGPSVVSYTLDGRKASRLPIPAYRCIGAGLVTVLITVDNAGNVVSAKIQEGVSSEDKCLRDFAIRAAKMSRFSASQTAPSRQNGDIVYQFVAQ